MSCVELPIVLSNFVLDSRNNMDLNRNFPDRSREPHPLEATGFEEPEVLAVMNWVQNGQFVASANMHEGSLVANYPYDHSDDGSPGYAKAPDDAALKHIARTYSDHHKTMHKSEVRAAVLV